MSQENIQNHYTQDSLHFFVNQDPHTAEPHTITAFCLLALSAALFYQARRAKMNPENSIY